MPTHAYCWENEGASTLYFLGWLRQHYVLMVVMLTQPQIQNHLLKSKHQYFNNIPRKTRQSDPKRGQHIQNAIKYSTSLWPLFLSAYQKTIDDEKAQSLEPLLILLLT